MNQPSVGILAGLYGAAQARPLYSRFPLLYSGAPSWLKSIGRRMFASRQGRSASLIERYLARLDDLPASDGRPVPLLLTHDVDTGAGLANLGTLLDAEESLGMRSLTLVVTHRYSWDRRTLETFASRGHAFGVHDTTHDNRLVYLSAAKIEARLGRAQAALGSLDIGAFRAPAFLRTAALYRALERTVRIDLSAIDWALLWPHPGDGIGTPFPVRHGRTLCIPTTLPRDGELIALELTPSQMVDLWMRKALTLWRVGAPAVLLTHPDPAFTDSRDRIATYREFLAWARSSGKFSIDAPRALLAELERDRRVEQIAVDV